MSDAVKDTILDHVTKSIAVVHGMPFGQEGTVHTIPSIEWMILVDRLYVVQSTLRQMGLRAESTEGEGP